jgi:hypothetical protein
MRRLEGEASYGTPAMAEALTPFRPVQNRKFALGEFACVRAVRLDGLRRVHLGDLLALAALVTSCPPKPARVPLEPEQPEDEL